jgi:hypothetical protein
VRIEANLDRREQADILVYTMQRLRFFIHKSCLPFAQGS